MDAEDDNRSESGSSEGHVEAGFERWLDDHIGTDAELSSLWQALREVLVAQIGEGTEITPSGVFAIVLSTLQTLVAEHGKIKEQYGKTKKVTVTKTKEGSTKPDAHAIQPDEVREAMRDHSDQLSAASTARIAAAARLLHYTSIKLPQSTAWSTLPISSPVLASLLKGAFPLIISIAFFTPKSHLLVRPMKRYYL